MQLILTTEQGSRDITSLVTSMQWSGDYLQVARVLEPVILSSPVDKSIPVIDCPLGAAVQMWEGKECLFDGFLFRRSKSTEGSTLPLVCFDRGLYLKRNKVLKKYTDKAPEEVVAELAGEFGFQLGDVVETGVKLSRSFITGKDSIFDVIATLYTLASQTTGKKYHIGFRGASMYVQEKKPDQRTLILQGGSNLISAAVSESIENIVNAVQIYDGKDSLVRTLRKDVVGFPGLMQEIIRQTGKDEKAAEAQKLLDESEAEQKITVHNLGNIANVTGGTVVLREPYTGLFGLFYIDSDLHEWKRGQYYNKLVLNYKAMMSEQEAGELLKNSGGGHE